MRFRVGKPMRTLQLTGFAILTTLAASAANAEIALLTNGRSLKISAYSIVDEDLIDLSLAAGGTMTLPLDRIERIVDDEIIPPAEAPQLTAGVLPNRNWRFDDASLPLFNSKFDEAIINAARKFDVDAALVSAVIKAESDYNPRVVSPKGARGLMQLMPATAQRFGVHDSFDPVANIYGGTRYLRWLLKTFDRNADHAVAAYNAGEGNVWKYKGIPPFRETVEYVKRIARHLERATPATSLTASHAETSSGASSSAIGSPSRSASGSGN